MTTPVTFTCYLADGVTRNPAATPSSVKFVNRSNVVRTSPLSITNLGLGKFAVEGSTDDETEGCAFLIATGCTPAYVFGSISTLDKPFAVVAFFTAAGAPISSGIPTIPSGGYQEFDGTALTPPALNAMGAYLFSLTPLDAELDAGGVNWIIEAPASAYPAAYDGDLIAERAAPSITVPSIHSFTPAPPISKTQTLGFDVTLSDSSLFSLISIVVAYDGVEDEESPYDGEDFSPLYDGDSYVEAITNGYRFHLKRRGGWPGNPTVKVRAVSASGIVSI